MMEPIAFSAAAIGVAACALLTSALLWRSVAKLRAHQRELIRQLEAVHQAQMAYAEATEGALSHLRDGLESLTTVSANLEMKTYSLELQAQAARSVAASSQRAKFSARQVASVPTRPLNRAEEELLAAVAQRN